MSTRILKRVAALALALVPMGTAGIALAQAPAAAAPTAASPELKRGRLLYIQCRACHELKAGEPNKVGPNLHGIVGARSGMVSDFAYSAALKGANLTWDRATLDKWLEKPSGLVPGNSMAFAGISSANDRAALLAYLVAETK